MTGECVAQRGQGGFSLENCFLDRHDIAADGTASFGNAILTSRNGNVSEST